MMIKPTDLVAAGKRQEANSRFVGSPLVKLEVGEVLLYSDGGVRSEVDFGVA
jgi:hypothetical protein